MLLQKELLCSLFRFPLLLLLVWVPEVVSLPDLLGDLRLTGDVTHDYWLYVKSECECVHCRIPLFFV